MKKIIITIFIFPAVIFSQQGWTNIFTTGTSLYKIYFVDENIGFTVGFNSKILKTTDGGYNWLVQASGITQDLSDVYFFDQNTGLTLGSLGKLLKTTNGGENWQLIDLNTTYNLYAIHFVNNNTGYISSMYGTVFKTTNGGDNWLSYSTGSPPHLSGIFFVNANTGYTVGIQNAIYKTLNGGVNWLQIVLPPPYYAYNDVFFIDSAVGYITGGNGFILRTTDSGVNWNRIDLPVNGYVGDIQFLNQQTGYCGGWTSYGFILYTSNGGINWSTQLMANQATCQALYMVNQNTGFTTGANGKIFKTTNGGISFVNPISTEIPNQFSLSQNYPNPFNPGTKIQFALPKSSFAKLVVFDALGKEVETLVNQQLTAGTYESDWPADNFSSGVYYYKLFAGDFTETKKMILIK